MYVFGPKCSVHGVFATVADVGVDKSVFGSAMYHCFDGLKWTDWCETVLLTYLLYLIIVW